VIHDVAWLQADHAWQGLESVIDSLREINGSSSLKRDILSARLS